ncbi:isocitrate lyase/phosphoenolpyruvate mutase family protein [Streptomyces sp. NBC_00083]|uniref:isocitrate lyase/PEP mutase family protein n=1 Tax=Streptomyces sp. NBC_00083 TaxID=2975647 RepID=UPI002252FD72|nr:isocitrate lyase/phosphoenolpyruvate mutase family protein [Streptomyces sp. NBC_00083]MCX5385164.1 isocitrate lyase/phosphoenolpyruvate mutase family protein [Streptomyces sp. NBC_00083]
MAQLNPAATFRALHQGRAAGDPLILPGPWDAASARVFEEAGFPALATPSAGVSASLGYEDGSAPADEMFAAVARIVRSVSVPVSADIEGGYGLAAKELVDRLLETGAVGCNLEDTADGALKDPARHADYLAEVRAEAGDRIFINARVDTYLRGRPELDETIARARAYVAAGADGVYPFAALPEHLPEIAAAVPVPVNMVARPVDPTPRRLGELGAGRVTFGPGLHIRATHALRDIARQVREL